jgi:hypothetical protein
MRIVVRGLYLIFAVFLMTFTACRSPANTTALSMEIPSDNEDTVEVDTANIVNTDVLPVEMVVGQVGANEAEEKDFLGIWMLEKIALHVSHISDEDIVGNMRYGKDIDVTNFIGLELEFTEEFVRLGERKLFYPKYNINVWPEEWLFSNREHVWSSGYFNSPQLMLDSFNDRGIGAGFINCETGALYYLRVSICYPEYPELWFRSTLLDPEYPDYVFNPLFKGFIMLNTNYMLVGSDILILASRVE